MALDDFFETEVGVAVAATAVLFSSRARKALRRGAVYGVAGALMAGDAIADFARGVGRGAQQATASTNGAASSAEHTTTARQTTHGTGTIRKVEDTTAEAARTVQDPALRTQQAAAAPGVASSMGTTTANISSGAASSVSANPAAEAKSSRKGREATSHE